MTPFVMAGHGLTRRGSAWSGAARPGAARPGWARHGAAILGLASPYCLSNRWGMTRALRRRILRYRIGDLSPDEIRARLTGSAGLTAVAGATPENPSPGSARTLPASLSPDAGRRPLPPRRPAPPLAPKDRRSHRDDKAGTTAQPVTGAPIEKAA